MVIGIALGAGCGAVMRYGLTQLGKNWWPGAPLATLVINASGAFCAGIFATLVLPPAWTLFLLTGVCGGYTTFSTFMTDALILLRNRRYATFAWYYFGTAALGILTLGLGAWVGTFF